MKRTAIHTRKFRVAPSGPEYAPLQGNFADTFDDRASESLVDCEDEREVVDVVVQTMIRAVN